MGKVRSFITDTEENKEIREVMMMEMIARGIKNLLLMRLREQRKQTKMLLEGPYKQLVIYLLNVIFSTHQYPEGSAIIINL